MASLTPAVESHYRRMQALQAVAVLAARRAWDHIDPNDISRSWLIQLPQLAPAVVSVQQSAATAGAEYGVLDLAQRDTYVQPTAFVNPAGFGTTAPSGVPLEVALASPAVRAKGWIGQGYSPAQALTMGRGVLDGMMRTFVADTARQAASVDITTRPRTGYIRMLNPPSCSSCVILAGKFYRWNAGFQRHPRCDCIHRPTTSADAAKAEGLIDDPYEYFNSLSEAEQNRIFGQYKAQAIRDGGDIYRVQNSWRGRDGLYTAEGTANQKGTFASFAKDLRGKRLTPEGIYRTATSREEALALLEQHGYIVPGSQVPGGSIVGPNYQGFGQMGRGGTRKGASFDVSREQATGVHDPTNRYTATAAERRLIDARLNYEAALAGRNPYGKGPATPLHLAQAELNYRRWLATGGQIYTS